MKNIFIAILVIFLSSCATKTINQVPTVSKSCKVVFKTKKIAFADTGFLNQSPNKTDLQIFAMGVPILELKVSDNVCLNKMCNSKQSFNQTHLSSYYPDDLIENILNKKPIFGGKNLEKNQNGFMQTLSSKWYNIKYKVDKENIYFKDKKNKIIIKITGLK